MQDSDRSTVVQQVDTHCSQSPVAGSKPTIFPPPPSFLCFFSLLCCLCEPRNVYLHDRVLSGLWIPGKAMGVFQNFQKFRVRVWKCYRTSRSSGYCGTGIQNSQKFRAGTERDVPVPRVLWHGSYITHRSSGYDYESLAELPEVPGTGMKVFQSFQNLRGLWYCGTGVQNFQNFRAGIHMLYPYLGSLRHRRAELPEVPGKGMSVLQKL